MATVNETKESAAFDCLAVTQVQVFPLLTEEEKEALRNERTNLEK